jgi:peptidoglycan/LPS O-acetylase OafA/YrhL
VGTLLALPLVILGHGWVLPGELWGVLATNLFAVQMWVPHPSILGRNIDGPSWTISTMAFFYLIFPRLLKRYQNRTDQSLNRSITVLMVIQAVVFFALYFAISKMADPNAGFWMAHAWPISRIPVFEMGVVAGLLVLRQGCPERDTNVKIMGILNV